MDICAKNLYSSPSPVLIDLVVVEIFSYLKLSDLKRCRIVCSLWNKIGMQVLQSKSNVKVVFQPFDFDTEWRRDQNPLRHLKGFAKLMSLRPSIPFCNYEFHYASFRNPVVKSFFKLWGSSVKCLSILKNSGYHNSQFLDIRTFSEMLTDFTPNLEKIEFQELSAAILESDCFVFPDGCANMKCSFPKLRTLMLPGYPRFRFDTKPCQLGGIWVQLLNAAPNLREIECCVEYRHVSTLPFSMLYQQQFLKALIDTNRLGSLTKLRIKHVDGSNLVQLTSGALKLGMSLIEFHVGTVNENCHPRSLQKFLETQRKTLKILTIKSSKFRASFLRINFPQMESLESLSLAENPELNSMKIENDVLTVAFPKLISLHIHAVGLRDFLNPKANSSHPGVKSLSIKLQTIDPSDIPTLTSIFPNINKVKLVTPESEQKILDSIWLAWPDAVQLNFLYGSGRTAVPSLR